jgi:hypothetical protein
MSSRRQASPTSTSTTRHGRRTRTGPLSISAFPGFDSSRTRAYPGRLAPEVSTGSTPTTSTSTTAVRSHASVPRLGGSGWSAHPRLAPDTTPPGRRETSVFENGIRGGRTTGCGVGRFGPRQTSSRSRATTSGMREPRSSPRGTSGARMAPTTAPTGSRGQRPSGPTSTERRCGSSATAALVESGSQAPPVRRRQGIVRPEAFEQRDRDVA